MRICVVGIGYVGLVTSACFAEMGNTVHCVDIDEERIRNLKNGVMPVYEPGLSEIVSRCMDKSLFFTTDMEEALEKSTIAFIAVGTPPNTDGSVDMRQVHSVAEQIGQLMAGDMIVVNKSTVPVGTADAVKQIIQGELDGRQAKHKVSVVSNPEFLKEGSAIEDCMRPDRVVVGYEDEYAKDIMARLYRAFVKKSDRLIFMDIPSAEMTKYAANAMLATRISFMNELSLICDKTGADIENVRIGIGSDSRIGYSFLYAGIGYGGSCFPKDVQALIKTAEACGAGSGIIRQVQEVNEGQIGVFVDKVLGRFGQDMTGRTVAVWGLSFKPNTDDMRMAPSIPIITALVDRGAKVKAYDPIATTAARDVYLRDVEGVEYTTSKYDALSEADALLLVTEWKEFRSPDFDELIARMKQPVIFDGRNQYDPSYMRELGIEYYGMGRR